MDEAQQFTKAVEHFQAGDLDGAEQGLAPLGGLDSDHPDVLHLSAVILLERNRAEEAADCFERLRTALKGAPAPLEILRPMAVAYQRAGRMDAAAKVAQEIVDLAPESLDDRVNLAFMLLEAGRAADALPEFDNVLAQDAACADAHYGRGRAAFALKQPAEADASYAEATRLAPGDSEAMFWHARALQALGDRAGAIEKLHAALTVSPDYLEAYCDIGTLLAEAADMDNAMRAYGNALQIDASNAVALNGLGTLQSALGHRGEAEESFRAALASDPQLVIAHCNLAEIKRFDSFDEDATALGEQVDRPEITEEEQAQLGFALGKVYEDLGKYDEAFSRFSAANQLYRAGLEYDPDDDEALATAMIGGFDAAAVARFRDKGAGCDDAMPIFVLGMPRSATTLIEQILASHSAVHGAGELDVFEALLGENVADLEALAELEAATLSDLGQAYVSALSELAPAGTAHVVDKMPTNFLFLGPIASALPRAKIIHCVRDPLDVCLSCYKRLFSHRHPYSYDLEELGRFYKLYERLIDHWRAVFPDRIVDVVYEDLIADPESETRRVIAACGLDWEDSCLAFHETERPVLTNPEGVRQPIYKDAVRRWEKYESHLGPLMEILEKTDNG